MRRSCLPLLLLAAAAAAQDVDPDLAAALDRFGPHAAAMRQALAAVPREHEAALRFLIENLPDEDAGTLDPEFLLREVRLAHEARAAVPWGAALPDALFLGYVVPYAQANERREHWRTDFQARFLPLVRDCTTPGEAAKKLNETIFGLLNVHYSTGRARADQAPSESIAQGKASCTGLSILLADACRACCVPARLVSVRWPHKQGNHTWVEVWDGAAWRFVGADEPDPAGLDRGWFVADAALCADAAAENRVWAVSFAASGQRFPLGWTRSVLAWGTDETARYVAAARVQGDDGLRAQCERFFAADAARQAKFEFDRNLDAELRTPAGDARLRAIAFAAWKAAERAALQADFAANRVRTGSHESPYVVRAVGERPANGWPLVVAMHGGGGVKKEVNDGQWRHMQVYYRDQPQAGGYLYCALRAPTDEWNGFYTDYFYPLFERLVRQFVVCGDVDPERVIAIGYSHGGYGAFALGPKLPHRFAAVHASAAAPTDGESSPVGLHTLAFSFMVGGRDTAYGRRERCEAFAARLGELQKEHAGRYATTFTLVEKNGHTGLPDRDLLADLVGKVRVAPPRALHWQLTDGVVRDHYWLHAPTPSRGGRIDARLDGKRLAVTTSGVPGAQAWLDARIADLTVPLELVVDGESRPVSLEPSLRVLCTTLQQRGDPGLAASVLVPLRP